MHWVSFQIARLRFTWYMHMASLFPIHLLICTQMTDVRSLDSLPYLQNQFKVDRVMMSLLNARHYQPSRARRKKSFLINRIRTRYIFIFPFTLSACAKRRPPPPSFHNGLAPIGAFRHNLSVFTPACRPQALFKVPSSERCRDRRLAHYQVTTGGLYSHSLPGVTGVNHP